jgi:hypothetical protein
MGDGSGVRISSGASFFLRPAADPQVKKKIEK